MFYTNKWLVNRVDGLEAENKQYKQLLKGQDARVRMMFDAFCSHCTNCKTNDNGVCGRNIKACHDSQCELYVVMRANCSDRKKKRVKEMLVNLIKTAN